jgi:hypothetical protein
VINILIFSFLILFSVLHAENKNTKPKPIQNNLPKLLDSNSLMKEVKDIKNIPNLLKSTREIEYLKKSLSTSKFYFQQTVNIKRNALISGDRILWFKIQGQKTEIKLSFDKLDKDSFKLIQEHDFITAIVKFENITKFVEFKFEKLINIEPFNPKGEMLNFHNEFEKFKILKSKFKYTKFRDQMKTYSFKNKNTLGYLTGIVSNIKLKDGEYLMEMTVNNYKAIIKCHPHYTKILVDLDMNTQITMVALLDNINEKNHGYFFRGCLINNP